MRAKRAENFTIFRRILNKISDFYLFFLWGPEPAAGGGPGLLRSPLKRALAGPLWGPGPGTNCPTCPPSARYCLFLLSILFGLSPSCLCLALSALPTVSVLFFIGLSCHFSVDCAAISAKSFFFVRKNVFLCVSYTKYDCTEMVSIVKTCF